MKSIDTKSLLIGALLTSTIFLGVAAVVPKDTARHGAWDDKQEWAVRASVKPPAFGWQPFAAKSSDRHVGDVELFYRKRIK